VETFRIKAVPGDQSCTLVMTGEADLAVAPDLVELGYASLGEPATLTLIVDLEAVTFIDSTAIGALIQLQNRADSLEKQLILAKPPRRVRQVIAIAGLEQFFALADQPEKVVGFG
jgi:anti-sigma B factor antagonist